MAAFPYLVGRPKRDLGAILVQAKQAGTSIDQSDKTFAATRLDDGNILEIAGGKFAHCTFLNVGFKGVRLKECNFEDCVFVACYFRRSTWERC